LPTDSQPLLKATLQPVNKTVTAALRGRLTFSCRLPVPQGGGTDVILAPFPRGGPAETAAEPACWRGPRVGYRRVPDRWRETRLRGRSRSGRRRARKAAPRSGSYPARGGFRAPR